MRWTPHSFKRARTKSATSSATRCSFHVMCLLRTPMYPRVVEHETRVRGRRVGGGRTGSTECDATPPLVLLAARDPALDGGPRPLPARGRLEAAVPVVPVLRPRPRSRLPLPAAPATALARV